MIEHDRVIGPVEKSVLVMMQHVLRSNLDYPSDWIVAHAKAAGVDVVVATGPDGLPLVQLAPRVEQPTAPVDEALARYMEEFKVPAFTPPPAAPAKYVWWSWSPVYPKWSESCWHGSTITEVRDRPCRDPEILNGWRFYTQAREKRKEGDEPWT